MSPEEGRIIRFVALNRMAHTVATFRPPPQVSSRRRLHSARNTLLPMPVEGDEEVVYELEEWDDEQLETLRAAISNSGINHRWEGDTNLVVHESDEAYVDALCDEIEGDSDDSLDDDASYDDMSMIFELAFQLSERPGEPDVATDFVEATIEMKDLDPPYGVGVDVWATVKQLAGQVVESLEAGADDEIVAAQARDLRDFLHQYV